MGWFATVTRRSTSQWLSSAPENGRSSQTTIRLPAPSAESISSSDTSKLGEVKARELSPGPRR